MKKDNFYALLTSKDDTNIQLAIEMSQGDEELYTLLKEEINQKIQILIDQSEYEPNPLSKEDDKGLEDFEHQLKDYFSDIFGKEFVSERFELPQDFKAFLELRKGFYQSNWRSIYHSKHILSSTLDPHYDWAIDDLRERVGDQQLEEGDTLWLCIGYWSDKHDYFVCCDKTHPYFGKIFDYHDASPYGYSYDCYSTSFLQFLRALGPRDEEEGYWQY